MADTLRRTRADYQRCAKAGMTVAETAAALGVSVKAVYCMSGKGRLVFAASPMGRPMEATRPTTVAAFSASPQAIERALAKMGGA